MAASVSSIFVPDGSCGVDVDLPFVGLGQQLGADARIEDGGQHDETRPPRRSPSAGAAASSESRGEYRIVDALEELLAGAVEAAERACVLPLLVRQSAAIASRAPARSSRRQNSDIESENITTNDSCVKRMLEMPVQEEQRHEHRDVRQRRRENRGPDFLAAVDRRRHPVLAHVEMPMRVLEHDDRGVDDHADARAPSPPNVIVFSVKPPK